MIVHISSICKVNSSTDINTCSPMEEIEPASAFPMVVLNHCVCNIFLATVALLLNFHMAKLNAALSSRVTIMPRK